MVCEVGSVGGYETVESWNEEDFNLYSIQHPLSLEHWLGHGKT